MQTGWLIPIRGIQTPGESLLVEGCIHPTLQGYPWLPAVQLVTGRKDL